MTTKSIYFVNVEIRVEADHEDDARDRVANALSAYGYDFATGTIYNDRGEEVSSS